MTIENEMKVVLVMGITGAGKSYLIREISGNKDVVVGNSLGSCTQQIEEVRCQIGDHSVMILDTPGFDDTARSDTEVLKNVATYLESLYNSNYRISGIIYLHNILDDRMRGSSTRNLKMFAKLCGENSYHNVVMVTGSWNTVAQDIAEKKEKELKENFWRMYLTAGCQLERYRDRDDLIRIFGTILPKPRVVLDIQHEMAVQGKLLGQTSVGQEINREILRMIKEIYDQQAAQAADYKRQNGQMKIEMDNERLEYQRNIKKLEADKFILMEDHRRDTERYMAEIRKYQIREYSRMKLPAKDMKIIHMGTQYWKIVEDKSSSYGSLAQLNSVWWMDISIVFRDVLPGSYKVHWRLKVKNHTPVLGSEFRVVIFGDNEESDLPQKLEVMIFKPKTMEEFTEKTRSSQSDFVILEIPGTLEIEKNSQNVYLQIRNHEGWKHGLYIDYAQLVDQGSLAMITEQ